MINLLLSISKHTASSPLYAAIVAMAVSVIFSLFAIPFQISKWIKRRKKIKEICCKCMHCIAEYDGKGEVTKFSCGLKRDFSQAEKCFDNGYEARKTPIPISDKKKEKRPFNFRDKTLIKKSAIITSIISTMIIVLSLIFVPVAYNAQIEATKKEAKSVTASSASYAFESGSINKRYTVYMIEGSYDSNNHKDKYDCYYLFQSVGGKVRCYRTSTGTSSKAAILNYFADVREEKPSLYMMIGGWFVVDVILCILAISAVVGSWGWWYYLHKHNNLAVGSKDKSDNDETNDDKGNDEFEDKKC